MKILSLTCGSLLAIVCSLAALYRYWLIMTFGIGFSTVGDERLSVSAHASLLTGVIGLLLTFATVVGYPMLSRRKFSTRIPFVVGAPGLRSA
jgi:hypothetical protein